jgi:hypothetical protein
MIPLTTLWLPILLSAVIVFIASNILWMALPFWHRSDYDKLPNEKAALDAVRDAKSGQYMIPRANFSKLPAEEREAIMKGPMAFMILRNPASDFSFPAALVSYFIYALVISILVAYIPAVTLRPGTQYLEVFRIVGTAGILAYTFGSVPDAIWYGKPWPVVIKNMVDGVIYGLLTAGVFGWLWPR